MVAPHGLAIKTKRRLMWANVELYTTSISYAIRSAFSRRIAFARRLNNSITTEHIDSITSHGKHH
uniref:Uncharacterized protein n=1 Tax=Parascaris univalens TaxID=6257 RepID=A0A915B5P0_PARUN